MMIVMRMRYDFVIPINNNLSMQCVKVTHLGGLGKELTMNCHVALLSTCGSESPLF